MLPDNRLKFQPTLIDFATQVGLTGQEHDNYPAPGQARYDWMRCYLNALLACQSSFSEPTEYTVGSLWFDLNTNTMRTYIEDQSGGGTWQSLSQAISLIDGDTPISTLNLQAWFNQVNPIITSNSPNMTFSGSSTANNTTRITIPTTLQTSINLATSTPFVYINGVLVDPRFTVLSGPTTIVLGGSTVLNLNDKFTVEIKNIPRNLFWVPDVSAP